MTLRDAADGRTLRFARHYSSTVLCHRDHYKGAAATHTPLCCVLRFALRNAFFYNAAWRPNYNSTRANTCCLRVRSAVLLARTRLLRYWFAMPHNAPLPYHIPANRLDLVWTLSLPAPGLPALPILLFLPVRLGVTCSGPPPPPLPYPRITAKLFITAARRRSDLDVRRSPEHTCVYLVLTLPAYPRQPAAAYHYTTFRWRFATPLPTRYDAISNGRLRI